MPQSDEYKYGYKYPFVACEILCSENTHLIETLFEEKTSEEIQSKKQSVDMTPLEHEKNNTAIETEQKQGESNVNGEIKEGAEEKNEKKPEETNLTPQDSLTENKELEKPYYEIAQNFDPKSAYHFDEDEENFSNNKKENVTVAKSPRKIYKYERKTGARK